MTKAIGSFIYSDPSLEENLLEVNQFGQYQYSNPSLIQNLLEVNQFGQYQYSNPSLIQNLLEVNQFGQYQYSEPSLIQSLEELGVVPAIEIVGGNALVYKNIRSVSATIRVYDSLTNNDLPDPSDVFEYSFEEVGSPDNWIVNTDEHIQILDPDNTVPAGTMERNYVLKVRVTRGGGYIAPGEVAKPITIDEVAPIVSANPVGGSYGSGETIELLVNDFTSSKIYYTTDGTNPDINSMQYTGAFGMMSAEVRFFAEDSAGNQSSISSETYLIDDIAPLISLVPDDLSLSLGEVCTVTWHVNEDCQQVIFELGGDGVNIGTGSLLNTYSAVNANTPDVTVISSTSLPDGASTINVYATDIVGNVGHESFVINYSSFIPTITVHEIFRPTLAIDEIGTIIWTSDYDGSYSVELGGSNPGDGVVISTGNYVVGDVIETSVDPHLFVANAVNDIKVYVTSSVGNVGSAVLQMTTDTEAPTTSLNHYDTENPFGAPFILTIAPSDNVVSGISTDLGGNVGEDLPYNPFGLSGGFNVSTDWMTGSYQYSDPSLVQAMNVINRFGAYQYSDPSLVQAMNVISRFGAYQYSDSSIMQYLNVTNPIVISNVAFMTTATTATVTWDTLRVANSTVFYSQASDLSGALSETDSGLVNSHAIGITGLQPDTTYYFKVVSENAGVSEESIISTFTTASVVDTIPPTITNVTVGALSGTEILATWTTDEMATSAVEYGLQSDLSDGVMTAVTDLGGVLNHSVTVHGLLPDTQYYLRVYSKDRSANENESISSIFTATTWDIVLPVNSNIVLDVYKTVAVIRWDTDEPTLGRVEYGLDTNYGFVIADADTTLKTSHTVLLHGLTPNVVYHFNVISEDNVGNISVASDALFTTEANRDDRLTVYATTDGSEPSTSNYGYISTGSPLNININNNTVVKFFAADAFGNHQAVQTQSYLLNLSVPVITFDSMTPILLGAGQSSIIRFKVDTDAAYEIFNQENVTLASGNALLNTWLNAEVFAADMVEGYNHITIRATDSFNQVGSLQIGHIIKDTIPAEVIALPPAGNYNADVFVDLIPQNLRPGEQVTIYYTTDGTMPTLTSPSALGQVNDIQVSDTGTIRWFSVDEAGNVEPTKYAHYVIDRVSPSVTATPLPGTYDEILFVELIPSEVSTIYYTLDGGLPTENSDIYIAPIQILRDTTIRCFAKDLAGNVSNEIYSFEYVIQVFNDKRFKKVIGFQDKMLLETEVNEMQDNLNRRIEELANDVVGQACAARGFDITLSDYTFEFFIGKGKAYIGGKFVTIVRGEQEFIPSPATGESDKTFYIIIKPNEPIFSPKQPGQPGWEMGVPEITTYRLEEYYKIDVVETLPDNELYLGLYKVFRPVTATKASDCTVTSMIHEFESLCTFQSRLNQEVSEIQANFLALGLEVESYKIRNLLGLKNAFVDTFESVNDVDMSKSTGFRYNNTRFEL